MQKDLHMEMSPMYTSTNDHGIVTSYLMKSDVDQKQLYDSNLYLEKAEDVQHWLDVILKQA